MAWKDTLFDASFRGVPFDAQRTDDTIDRDTAEYAVPHVDGEDVEDLGLKAHTTSLTAIFFGDDYEVRMKALLAALAVKGPGELIHPVFGSMPSMQLIGAHVSHDADNVDACVIEMHVSEQHVIDCVGRNVCTFQSRQQPRQRMSRARFDERRPAILDHEITGR